MRWCSRKYLEFNTTFSLFYLFDCKFVDLIGFFLFTRQNLPQRFFRLRGFARPIDIGRAICLGLDVINLSQQNNRCNLNLKHLQYDLRGCLYIAKMENLSCFHFVFTWTSGLPLQRSNLGKWDEQKSIQNSSACLARWNLFMSMCRFKLTKN